MAIALLACCACADGQTAVVDTTTDVSGPTRLGLSAGGASTRSSRFQLQVVVGAPAQQVTTGGARFRLAVAPSGVAR